MVSQLSVTLCERSEESFDFPVSKYFPLKKMIIKVHAERHSVDGTQSIEE